jgi:HlyD family secretion protein
MTLQFAKQDYRPTGAAMDQPLPRRRYRRLVAGLCALLAVLVTAAVLWRLAPRGLQVPIAETRIAVVARGVLRDDVVARATATPLHSVVLDVVEAGRVEEVFARDGALTAQGAMLFRLSNPQRRIELLARESERAQQISNLLNMRVSFQASRTGRQRRVSELRYALEQAGKRYTRNAALARQGFLSAAALEDSADQLAQQRRLLDAEQAGNEAESTVERNAASQMQQAIARLEAGLQLVHATIDALVVRAPVAGRLTDFRLQVGETVKPDQRIGRIDDPSQFKLSAQLDEYYLGRIEPGLAGLAAIDGRMYALSVTRTYPQIRDGKFTLELGFDRAQPRALKPGQGVEVSITLGRPAPGLLVRNDAFFNETGGAWAFVISRDGGMAERRLIRTGRHNSSQVEVLSGLVAGERVIVSSYAGYGRATRLQLTQ